MKNVSNVLHTVYGEFVNQVLGVRQQMWARGSITTGLSSGEDTTLTTWNSALIKHGGKVRNADKNFIREYEGKKPIVRPRIRRGDNIKKLLNGNIHERVKRIQPRTFTVLLLGHGGTEQNFFQYFL